MRRLSLVAAGLLLSGCVSPPPGRPGYVGGYGLGPDRRYELPGPSRAALMPLPEDAIPARTRAAAVRTPPRPRPAAPTVDAVLPAPAAPAVPAATAAVPPAPAGPECRTVTQVGYADGKEVQKQERFCRAAPGREWVRS